MALEVKAAVVIPTLNLNNWVNDWSCLGAQTAWHYNTINHECNQNKWVKSSCHGSSQHKIYVFTKLHLTIQINLQWWHTTPFWKAGEIGLAGWRKKFGGLRQGCYYFFFPFRHFSPSEEKAFHVFFLPQQQFVKLASFRPAVPITCIQECKECKKSFSFTRGGNTGNLFPKCDKRWLELMSGFPSMNTSFKFHTGVRTAHPQTRDDTHHAGYLNNKLLSLVRLEGWTQKWGQNTDDWLRNV